MVVVLVILQGKLRLDLTLANIARVQKPVGKVRIFNMVSGIVGNGRGTAAYCTDVLVPVPRVRVRAYKPK